MKSEDIEQPQNIKAQPGGLTETFYCMALIVMVAWLCIIGKSIIVPVMIGIIGVYLFVVAADALKKIPLLKEAPRIIRRLLILVIFTIILFGLILFIVQNAQGISGAVPRYANHFEDIAVRLFSIFGVVDAIDWDMIIAKVTETISISSMMNYVVSSVYSFGTVLITALLYAVFLAAELDDLPEKTRKAFGSDNKAASAITLANRINQRVGAYLGAKTLVNMILGLISLIILLFLGVEFALFWALLIALFNYIPYIGSIIGVMFPVSIALLQTGSLLSGALAFVTLMGAQIYVGSFLEPKMLGRSVNLSPFVVLLALSFWVGVWGSIGAILAVPLTAVVMIILSEIESTRPFAILMSERGEI